MNREELYGAIGELDEALLERSERGFASEWKSVSERESASEWKSVSERESACGKSVCKKVSTRKRISANKRGLRRLFLAVACVGLLIMGVRETIDRLGLFRMGCIASAGTLVDGVYYYHVGHNGLWQYTPEDGSCKVVSEWNMDGWQVNTYGIYYSQGRSLYVREHESGKSRRLFQAGFWDSSFINFTLQKDGNIVAAVHNTRKKTIYQILLDGVTGEVLEQVTELLPYPGYEGLLYSEAHFQVGDRQITLVPVEGKNTCDVTEDGKSLLKEGERVYYWLGTYYGDNLFLRFRDGEDTIFVRYLVLRPDGNDSELVSVGGIPLAGTNEYLFYSLDPRVYGTGTGTVQGSDSQGGEAETGKENGGYGGEAETGKENGGYGGEAETGKENGGYGGEAETGKENGGCGGEVGTAKENGGYSSDVDLEKESGRYDETESVGYAYDTIWCREIATGEYWQLETEMGETTSDLAGRKVLAYDMETDGELLFTCAPWSSEQMCWKIVCDEAGRPKTLQLISGDITKDRRK